MADYQETTNRHYKKVNAGVKPWWLYYHELLDQLDTEIQQIFDKFSDIDAIQQLLNNHSSRHEAGGDDEISISGLKGSYINVDTINENTTDNGVIIDGLSIKDGRLFILNPIADNEPTPKKYMEEYVQQYIQGLDYQDSVLDKDLTTPPATPNNGDRYLLFNTPDAGTDWEGHQNDIAEYDGTQWNFITPNKGFTLEVEDEGIFYNFNGTDWIKLSSTIQHNNTTGLQGGTTDEYYHFTSQEHSDILSHIQDETIHRIIDDNNPSLITLYSGTKIEDRISNHSHTFQQIYDSESGSNRVVNFSDGWMKFILNPYKFQSFGVFCNSFGNNGSVEIKEEGGEGINLILNGGAKVKLMKPDGTGVGAIFDRATISSYYNTFTIASLFDISFRFIQDNKNILLRGGETNLPTYNGKTSIIGILNELISNPIASSLDASYNSEHSDNEAIDRIINIDDGNLILNLSTDYWVKINREAQVGTDNPLFEINYWNNPQGSYSYIKLHRYEADERLILEIKDNLTYNNHGHELQFKVDALIDYVYSEYDIYVGANNEFIISMDRFGLKSNLDIEIINTNYGIILKSPSGNRFRLKVDDSGNLSTEAL